MKTILVTGGSGFVGHHCLTHLVQQGFHVHAFTRQSRPSTPEITWHSLDLFNLPKIAEILKEIQPTHLLHLAWVTEHGNFWHSPLNLAWMQASLELALQFAKQGGKRCVFVGTCAEYGQSDEAYHEEKTPLNPHTLYGVSKNALRHTVEKFFSEMGISFCWARIFYPYGPGENPKRLIPWLIRSFLQQQPVSCTAGEQKRDLVFINDVADALVTVLGSSLQGCINIGSGMPLSIKDVCLKIADFFQAKHLLKMGAIASPLHDDPIMVADTTRLKNELLWSAKVNLDEGLFRSIEWWKEQQFSFINQN